MADAVSEQITNKATLRSFVDLREDPNHSQFRRQTFRYIHKNATLPGVGDKISFCRIPKGVRLFGGKLFCDGQIGADTTKISLGVAGDVAGYLAATVMGAAAITPEFNHTVALDFMKLTSAEKTLIGTISVAAIDGVDDLEINGYIDYTLE